jgi:hypothetical protein
MLELRSDVFEFVVSVKCQSGMFYCSHTAVLGSYIPLLDGDDSREKTAALVCVGFDIAHPHASGVISKIGDSDSKSDGTRRYQQHKEFTTYESLSQMSIELTPVGGVLVL